MDRKQFDIGNSDVDIVLSADGSLTIEAYEEYGDSEDGWGSTTATIRMEPDVVKRFVAFLLQTTPAT